MYSTSGRELPTKTRLHFPFANRPPIVVLADSQSLNKYSVSREPAASVEMLIFEEVGLKVVCDSGLSLPCFYE
jgi:hypothetical protein